MKTLLFDIDGTLLLTHQGGSIGLQMALQQAFQIPNPSIDVSFGGRTDRALLAQLLEINELPDTAENRDQLLQKYVQLFPQVLRERGGDVLPGVPDLLERLAKQNSIRQCVMTGNVVATAKAKLEFFDLAKYFQWIEGGEFDRERNALARRAAARIRAESDPGEEIIVIGDTVADVHCGQAIGAKVIAVCTGSGERQQLADAGADVVLDDLSQTDQVFALLMQ